MLLSVGAMTTHSWPPTLLHGDKIHNPGNIHGEKIERAKDVVTPVSVPLKNFGLRSFSFEAEIKVIIKGQSWFTEMTEW